MTVLLRRASVLFAAAAGLSIGAGACGAGLNAVYEGDVRFEHCMALDAQPEEKPSARKECWDEWVQYYTFGQTRDRVSYARLRRKQLEGGADERALVATPTLAQRAVPEPTTVTAPPPMMITDASAPEDATVDAVQAAPEPPAETCAKACRDAWTPCKQACTSAVCEKTCATAYKRCMKRCY